MKIPWFPILGALSAFALNKLIGHYFGTTASVLFLCALLLSWWGLHLFHKKNIRTIHARLSTLGDDERARVLAEIGPEVRKDLDRLELERKKA